MTVQWILGRNGLFQFKFLPWHDSAYSPFLKLKKNQMEQNKAVILCVDDEIVILNSLKKQLKKAFGETYNYEMAESADEALEILEELQLDETNILLIVSDWLMPGMKGDELLIQVHQKYGHIITIMLTGQADDDAIKRAKEQANLYCCLHKPLNTKQLIETIQSGLASHG